MLSASINSAASILAFARLAVVVVLGADPVDGIGDTPGES